MRIKQRQTTTVALFAMLFFVTGPALGQSHGTRIEALEAKAEAMAEELAVLRAELAQAKEGESIPEVQALRAETAAAKQAAQRAEKSASEWKDTSAVTHLAGYASADYISPENGNSAFAANFNPMFHYQFNDKILWEAELEIEVEENGDTGIGLEYSSIDLFLTDNLILVAGKFLSPLGNFRQNMHPSWINKLPSAPPGFGHDGAAPLAEVGMQLRGGVPFGQQSKLAYAGYIGNGPKLEAEAGEIHAVETEGFAGNPDDKFVFGGRVSLLPIPKLEIAISGALGDIAVVENDGADISGDPTRDYTVFGFDASYQIGNLDFRGEYISQEVDAEPTSIAPEGGKWDTWYVQGAYKFGQAKWEGVLRYTDFKSPHADDTQDQFALGLNYLLAPSAMIKVAYESNSGLAGEATDDDRLLFQIAYGY
jgi:Gram-negative porin